MVPSLRWLPSVSTARSRIMKSPHAISSSLADISTSSWPRTCVTMPQYDMLAPQNPVPIPQHAKQLSHLHLHCHDLVWGACK